MMKSSEDHELDAVKTLNALDDQRVMPSPVEQIAIAQVYATMAMASAIYELAAAVNLSVGRKIK